MKKTILVTIDKFSFQLTQEAYAFLENYLESIKIKLEKDIADEVINDIEYRIADLMLQKGEGYVFDEIAIKEIANQIGHPNDFSEDDQTGQKKTNQTFSEQNQEATSKKRLFRDEQDKILGGVCSGIASYFNIDPVIVRGVFVIFFLTFGTGVLAYLVLYFIMPPAKNSIDILQMKGENTSFEMIKKKVTELSNDVKGIDGNKFVNQMRSLFESFVNALGKIGKVIFGSLKGIFGSITLLISLVVFFCGIIVFFKPDFVIVDHNQKIQIELEYMTIVGIGLIVISLSMFFYRLFSSLYPKFKINYLGIVTVLTLIIGISLAAKEGRQFINKNVKHFAISSDGVDVDLYGNAFLDLPDYDKIKNQFDFKLNKIYLLKSFSLKTNSKANEFRVKKDYFNYDSTLIKTITFNRNFTNGLHSREHTQNYAKEVTDTIMIAIELNIPIDSPFKMDQTLVNILKSKNRLDPKYTYRFNDLFVYDGVKLGLYKPAYSV